MDNFLSLSCHYIGLIALTPFKGIIPKISEQTKATRKMLNCMLDNMHYEKINEVTYSANDYINEIDNKIYSITNVEDNLDKAYIEVNKLKEEFDFILIDCPAGIEQGFKNAIAGADRAIVVTNAEISSIRDADRIIGLLEASEIKNPELIVNRLRPNMVRKGEMMDVDDIVDLLSINLIGVVPDDEFIITQTNKGEPAVINKKAPSGRAYLEIARRILGENIDVTIPGKDEGFFSKLKHIFRK